MSNAAEELIWSTWEELLLAFAVKRHGLEDWDTVATELQNRHRHCSSLPPTLLFTPQICKNKFRNLKRRFTDHQDNNTTFGGGGDGGGGTENNCNDDDEINGLIGGDGGESDSLPWLEELRKLRVAELKREVHRYDLSIRSLQVKVRTMEAERERSLKDDDVKQPDLDEEVKQERSENDKNDGEDTPEEVAGNSVSGCNNENMSFNESNSTESKRAGIKTDVKPESESKAVGEEVSCNDSSTSQEREKGWGDSAELRDSVSESKEEGTKESSDVQSSASLLTRKRKKTGGGVLSPATASIKREVGVEVGAVKSEPSAAWLLDKIRLDIHGSVFERRLECQNTEKYKSTIRRHADLETIQARMDDGSYSLSPMKFYVDLLLLFTNAIVFFPKSSSESLAAEELRQLVMKELKNSSSDHSPSTEPISTKPKPKPEPERSDSLLAQHYKSTNPIIASRKRSSISAKASSSSANNLEKQLADDDKPLTDSKTLSNPPLSTSNEEEDSRKLKMKEKAVTGVRSMRRSSKGRPQISKPPDPTPSSSNNKSSSSREPGSKDKRDKAEATKGDKMKSSEASASKKKSGAADFLKRMTKNSPAKGTLVESMKSSRNNSSNIKGSKKIQPKKKLDKRKDVQVRRSGGPGRKHAKEESTPLKKSVGRMAKKGKDVAVTGGKRRRESGQGEGSSKRPKKRSR